MKKIKLTQNKFAIISDQDYELISKITWHAIKKGSSHWYAYNNKYGLMHRFITKIENGYEIDHINSNGLDNRRSNLRICTHAQNMMNRVVPKNNQSGYKGVYFAKDRNKWIAQLRKNGRIILKKQFNKISDAISEYTKIAKVNFGEYYNQRTL